VTRLALLFLLFFLANCDEKSIIVGPSNTSIYDSGGVLMPEQATFDVNFYDLNLKVEPERKWIGGSLGMICTATKPLDVIVLQLDTLMKISRISGLEGSELKWKHIDGLVIIYPDKPVKANNTFFTKIEYSGHPLEVKKPKRFSWSDGFYWAETETGLPWVGNISVLNGADIWWPCKDHPSDEPDSMAINIRVDNRLKVAANGKLRGITHHNDNTNTYRWFVSTPINNYSVTMNIAPYIQIDTTFYSVSGESFPFSFWAIPEHYKAARNQFPHFVENMKFLEQLLGPYPFRIDKYGSAETYYLGMENQSIIAYGSTFELNEWGFDNLHFHELTHEWFANLVTARDWRHWWVHEGITSYIVSLYAEYLSGGKEETYLAYMAKTMNRVKNEKPIVLANEEVTTREGYISDVYSKGASVMHTLRHLIGKEKMYELLRTIAYPTEKNRNAIDGSQTRFITTDDVVSIASDIHGKPLGWFFDAYLFYSDIPSVVIKELENKIIIRWETGAEDPFTLPIPVRVGDEIVVLEMKDGYGELENNGQSIEIDPEGRILKNIVYQNKI
jgi:aminopeptidase N